MMGGADGIVNVCEMEPPASGGMHMAAYAETYDYDCGAQIVELGYFSELELNAFSLLIERRRSLPIYLGDGWRCQSCA